MKMKKWLAIGIASVMVMSALTACSQAEEVVEEVELITEPVEKGAYWMSYVSVEDFDVNEEVLSVKLEEVFYLSAGINSLGNPSGIYEIEYSLSEDCLWKEATSKETGGYGSLINRDTIEELTQKKFFKKLNAEDAIENIKFVSVVVKDNEVTEAYIVNY